MLAQSITTGNGTLTVHEKFAGYDLYKYSKGNVNGESAAYWNDLSSKYNVSDGDDIDHERNKPINIASKLKTYSLSYYNYNKVTKTEKSIKYTASLKSYANYTPAKPSELPSYYVFGGWYKDKACTTKFDFNTEKMPNANVQIYAKWTAQKINLTFNLNTPDGTSKVVNRDVDAGTIANTVLPSATTTSDYSFAGWYYADGNGNITKDAFNANEAITKDTSVIGKWLYNGKLTVVYNPGTEESKATVPTDSNIYAGGAKVTVAKNATTTSNKKFLGWKLKGNLYYPGDAFEVNKDLANEDNVITLTAIWGNEESSTTMSYNPGNGRGSVKTVPVKNNNESVTLKSEKDWGYQAPEVEGKEYYFAGWATSMDDAYNGKATYAAGQTVHVDVNGENVLYATWIEKTVITLVAKSNTVTYNGEPQSVEGFEDVADGYIVSGLTAKATGTNVGEYTTKIEGTAKVKKGKEDVTEKVVVNVVPGQLTISKRVVTLKSETASKPYDGTPLTKPEVTITGEFVKGEVSDIKATGSVINVSEGKVTNTITYKTSDKFNTNNYTIVKDEGELSIDASTEKVTVNIKEHGGTYTYDSNEKTVEGYDVKSISNPLYTADDFKFNGTAKVSGTNAGTYDMQINVADFENKNTNFANVEFVIAEEGQLVIDKRSVTLESDTKSKPYDGTPLVKHNVTVSEDGFADGEGATYSYTGTQTDAGSSENTFTYALNEGTLASNYEITTANGTLTVEAVKTEVKVEITGHTDTVTYDGQVHSVSGYDVTNISNKLYSDTAISFTGTAVVSRIVAGTSYMGLTAAQFSNTSANFTNVTFVVHDGWLKVDPKSIIPDGPDTPDEKKTGIEVTKPADSKYDGNVHENKPEVKDTKTGATLVEGTDYTLSYKGDTTNAGTVTVTITGAGNYTGSHNVEYQITKRNVTLTSATASKVYDKTPLTNSNITIGGDGFAKLEGASYHVTGSQTNVGDSDNEFTYKLNDDTKASNYNIEVKFGKLYITTQDGQVIVVITGHKKTYDYDGTEKTVDGYDVSITEGSTYAETDFTFNGNAEVKATEANTYPMGLKASDFTNNNTNYSSVTFVVNDGSLVINPKSIIPDGPNTPDEKKTGIEVTNPEDSIYDGLPHVNPLTVTDTKTKTDLEENKDYTLTYSSDVINVGTVDVTVNGIGNYAGEFKKSYKITPREYTVTTESAKKVYDGTALTAGGKIEGIVDGETVEFTTTGSRTVEGTSKNTYSLKWNGSAIQTNYKLAKESIGDLTVTPKSIIPDEPDTPDDKKTGITVSNPKDSKYDGQEHREVLTVKDTKTGKDLIANKDYTVVYSDDLVNAGTVTIKVSGLGNYSGSFTKTYKITKRLVTLTSATVSKTYDGQALTNTSITVSGDGFVEGEGASYEVTGTQTSVGNSANAFEYKLNEKTLASNYDITKVVGTLTITAAPAPVTPPTSPTPVSPPPVTPRYIQQVVPALTPQEEVKKEKTPKAEPKEEKVEKEKTPKARPEKFWALINLICAIVTVLFGLLLLISKRHKNKDDKDDETKDQTTTNEDEEKEQEKKRGAFTRVLAVLIAILSVVFFLVTEDLSLRWTWTDQWTIWMVVIGLVQIVVFFVGRKWKNVDDDEDEEEAQQA